MEFQKYPLAMFHPRAQPAVISGYKRNLDGTATNDPPGKPAVFPPVTVNNQDQELLYASKGYVPNGTSDHDAYMRAVIGADEPSGYKFAEYPKWLYQCVGGEINSRLVKSAKDEEALGRDWYRTPDQAREAIDDHDPETAEAPAASSGDGAAGAVPVKEKRKYKKRKSAKKAKLVKLENAPRPHPG